MSDNNIITTGSGPEPYKAIVVTLCSGRVVRAAFDPIEWAEAIEKDPGYNLNEAIEGFKDALGAKPELGGQLNLTTADGLVIIPLRQVESLLFSYE